MAREQQRLKQQRTELTEDPFGAIREKGIVVMTQEDSEQIEGLLMDWYRWANAYRPHLGAPRVSAYGRGMSDTDSFTDGEEADTRIFNAQCKAVDVCLDELTWQARAAVGIHTANKACGNAIYKNPRLSPQQQHQEYQRAKLDLLPMLVKRGLMRVSERNMLHERGFRFKVDALVPK
ncbi:hypothetical protein [Schauerella aestuarii]|uniref:hypothetical protein n=1 Tax=Schauerella aestuarii TaxID=2511204 RepID=UPI0013688E48|nr:hypothetical protein [Achromobacter aestuarii]MYZ41405.1 hypothetical protein [Achromobacter aestuarii]